MKIFRSVLSLMLVLVATVLVSCGTPKASAPPTYTADKLQTIQTYRIPVDIAKERMFSLSEFISDRNWVDTKSFIHGPLGSLRRDFRYLSEQLLPKDKKQALEIAEDIFKRLENLDAAADEKNYSAAITEYNKAIADFDAYAKLIPEAKNS